MAKHLRLLEVAFEGYLIGTGTTRTSNRLRIPHEALVACLAGLLDPDQLRLAVNNASLDEANVLLSQDTLRAALRLLEFIAWKQGVASWGADHRPLDHVGHVPFFASE